MTVPEASPDDTELEREIFAAAIEADSDKRASIVRRACQGDAELERHVHRLIAAHERAREARSLESVVAGSMDPPEFIGPYQILESIGQGGMGLVYLAEQHEPIRRKVALKVIRAGMNTDEVLARFRVEREVLALMDHPNIARIFDSGATEQGLPYFVMEYVPGETLLEYCDTRRLPIQDRIRLFVRACRAVQHAHQKGIIHRDVKSSNVIVSEVDGEPSPKVIDFGIARAAERGDDDTVFTMADQWIGTPTYMSPEQVERNPDIDTRTDVYSLGVMLYELLTGALPFDVTSRGYSSLLEIQRKIREVDPPRPSNRLASTHAAEAADRRRTGESRLQAMLRGDLDRVVMKALEKDRDHRFDSAEDLARDLERYLNNKPVTATPPSRGYLLRKFVSRHRGLVTAAGLLGIALTLGAIGTSLGFMNAQRQRDLAETRARDLREVVEFQQTMLEQINAAEAGNALLQDLRDRFEASLGVEPWTDEQQARIDVFLSALDSANTTDAAVELIDQVILAPSVETARERFADEPLIEASLFHTLGTVYSQLGRYNEAFRLREVALAARMSVLGEDDPDTITSLSDVGSSLLALGRVDEAGRYLQQAFEARERILGPEHPDTILSMNRVGNFLLRSGRPDEGVALHQQAYELSRRFLGETELTFIRLGNLAQALAQQGRKEEALERFLEALEGQRRILPEDDPAIANLLNNLGNLHLHLGNKEQAHQYWTESYESSRRIWGNSHIRSLIGLMNLGYVSKELGQMEEAETAYQEMVTKMQAAYGNAHPMTLEGVHNLASLYLIQRRFEEVDTAITGSLPAYRIASRGTMTWKLSRALLLRGISRSELGRFEESERDLLDAYAIMVDGENAPGPEDPRAKACARQLSDLYDKWYQRQPGGGFRARSREWKSRW